MARLTGLKSQKGWIRSADHTLTIPDLNYISLNNRMIHE
jgi:hypothetical protein